MINARAETVAEKPSFRAAYRKRRCLVLADGFYEWHTESTGKTPYFISLGDGSPFAFAGLWEHWQYKDSDETLYSATLITVAANEFMSALHHRMPIVLDPARADAWLAGGDDTIQNAAQEAPSLKAWPVGREVNNPRNEGVNLIASTAPTLEI
jgi:putative SOS response-associated peptidase YedK